MSEEILKALMQLFAIITKQDGGVSENEKDYVWGFLVDTLGADQAEEYIRLYEKHSDYGKVLSENDKKKLTSVKDSVRTLAICKKINKTLSQKQKVIVLIRLFELLKADSNFSEQRVMIIDTVSDVFNIDKIEHKIIEQFVLSEDILEINTPDVLMVKHYEEGEAILSGIHANELNGFLGILNVESVDMYFIRYNGTDEISLNGSLVKANTINLFAYGSIIKLPKSDPIFYSDAVAHFLSDEEVAPISFIVEDVEFEFPNGGIGLTDINVAIGNNKLVAIMGASGAGKTTLLNTLSGLEKPSKGSIEINGKDIFADHDEIDGVIGYIAQDDILIEELTVYENLYFSAKLCLDNLSDAEIHERVELVLDNLGLWERKELRVGSVLDKTISGGQRKRLNIALELIREPDVLFVDEPTSGLSSRDSENVMDLLKELSLKGKLIFVVIHQPSSDIYKMFDKIIILDVGGFPIYNGHPVEAVTYFKREANQLNSESGQCETCGNVNPEQIFNIIEERVVDEYGNFTDNRKTNPATWHKRYTDKSIPDEIRAEKGNLPKNLFIPTRIKQLFLFTKRDVLAKLHNRQYMLINLLQAPILAAALAFIIKYIAQPRSSDYIFRENENLPAYLFMSIIVSFFMGLTVSAEEIIKDRKLLKRESLLNLSRNSYLFSKVIILFSLSAIQSFLFAFVGNMILEIHGMTISYWMMLFAISCSANILGLNISATFNSAITVYILIPLLVIPQMILSGAIFDYDKLNSLISNKSKVPVVADVMVARWAFEGLSVEQYKNNYFQKGFFEAERRVSAANYKQAYYIPRLRAMLDEVMRDELEIYHIKKKLRKTHDKKLKEKVDMLAEEIDADLIIMKNEIVRENEINHSVHFDPVHELSDHTHFKKQTAVALKKHFDFMAEYYGNIFNFYNHKKDSLIALHNATDHDAMIFNQIKDKYANDNMTDIMKNLNAKKRVIVDNDHLVQKYDPVYQNPSPLQEPWDYRTHFYSPKKPMFGRIYDTFWFNFTVIWIGTIFMYITLYFEVLRWTLENAGKIPWSKVLLFGFLRS